jgi:hypothetical protein
MRTFQVLAVVCVVNTLVVGAAGCVLAADPKATEQPAPDISAGIPAGEESAAVPLIEKALRESTELDFEGTRLSEAINVLKSKHGIEIQLNVNALDDAGTPIETPVTLHLKNISLRSALRLMLGPLDLKYVIKDEVLLITTKERCDAELRTRLYPVHDLMDRAVQENLNLTPASDLIATIIESVAPTTWDEVGGPGSIKYLPVAKCLVISQTEEIHYQIRNLLVATRKVMALQRAQPKDQAANADPDAMFLAFYRVHASAQVYQVASEPAAAADKDARPADKAATLPRAVLVSNRSLADDLARAIPKVVEPATWHGGGGQGLIESIGIGVTVRQTRRVHLQVASFLQSVEKANANAVPLGGGVRGGGMFQINAR